MATALERGPARMLREDVPADKTLCDYCTAKCCRYFALPIDNPEDRRDWDFIRWYLLHDRASVFFEDDNWYLLVHTTCKHLQDDNRCGIYETRPQICREYTTDVCEYEEDWTYERFLETPEQVWELQESLFQERGQNIRSARPSLMPVLS